VAREIEISLPRELSPGQRVELVRSFVKEQFVNLGMVADLALHCPKATDGKDQPHAHIMLTLRPLQPDNSGFGNKERAWNERSLLEHGREQWAAAVNQALTDADSGERIDHRTLKAQGVPRAPLPYLPLPVVTGQFRQVSAGLTGRMNQRNTVRFRKLALEILAAVHGSDRIAWGIMAATEEEAGHYSVHRERRDYVPQR
jgi:ATP-dependent exoDNAse (exonuclease V) alpha subunit